MELLKDPLIVVRGEELVARDLVAREHQRLHARTVPPSTQSYVVVPFLNPACTWVMAGASDNSHQLELSLNRFLVFYWPQLLVIPSDPCTGTSFTSL